MDKKEIVRRVISLPQIEALNPMQQAMLDCTAKSIILLAPTGSGKTLAFAIRILSQLRADSTGIQAIVIAPSRELAMQTAAVVKSVALGYKTTALYGGHSVADEVNSLVNEPAIIVSTPGRLLDHLQRGNISRQKLNILVIDEYDKALELGFEDEMKKIMSRLGKCKNTVMTSATELKSVPDYFFIDRPHIFNFTESLSDGDSKINIARIESPSRDKLQTLADLLHSLPNGKTIVFVGHRESAERVYKFLRKENIDAGLYHGGLEQEDRANAIDLLENGTTPVLVATDLASRGLDISRVQHIVHYHLPSNSETWTHRNGRTARQNDTGNVYVITSEADELPEYIVFNNDYSTEQTPSDGVGIKSEYRTLRLNLGRKEKISKGDILGYLTSLDGISAKEIGKIALHDHYALIAVRKDAVKKVMVSYSNIKIKGKTARLNLLKFQ